MVVYLQAAAPGRTIAIVAPAKAGAQKLPLVCARLFLEAGFRRHDVGDG